MNAAFFRREWGAVTFVLTVIVGLVVVPLALYLGNQSPAAPLAAITPSPTVTVSASPSPSPSPSASVKASASPKASPSPSKSP